MIPKNDEATTMRPIYINITGIFSFLIAGLYLTMALFYDGILNNRIFDYLTVFFFSFMGIFCLRVKYSYDNKYLFLRYLKQTHFVKLKDIIEISAANMTGMYIIRTNKGRSCISLLFQKKSIIRFAKHVKKYNENCKIDL